ncbi:hypothetical protein PIB30_066061, partial [Stylosanthes scabra]|nr:hypothetical protein [Stylosanthes scabra]
APFVIVFEKNAKQQPRFTQHRRTASSPGGASPSSSFSFVPRPGCRIATGGAY